MAKLVVHQDKITDVNEVIKICPFSAMEVKDGKVEITAGCKMCRLCTKKGPAGAFEYVEDAVKPSVDKSKWHGILVYIDHIGEEIHPVSFELLGKARDLADKTKQPVYALFPGYKITELAQELLHYGADKVFVYDRPELEYFSMERYTAVFEDFINKYKPSSILVGATPVGRQLAPRVAARFKTGLTADCTILDIEENTDLNQIRPAFGGNIMAHIITTNHRPQMATVRYKIMEPKPRTSNPQGEVVECTIPDNKLISTTEVLEVIRKPREKDISAADILIVAGRGLKKKEDVALIKKLATALNGEIACTRPLAENGWVEAKRQIGLSGKTVRPKLIITCGVSGTIQFVAGMNNSDTIIAINNDPNAMIFKVANYGIVGDLYEIVPNLIAKIEAGKKVS